MFDMDDVVPAAIELITENILNTAEAIDAIVLGYDLSASERRQLIQRLAKEGFKS